MKFLVFCGLLLVLTTLVDANAKKKCYVSGKPYNEGEEFKYMSDRTGCEYNCTCVILNQRPLGNCTHKCQSFSYPPGCMPVHNLCGCATNYTCIDGEKCQDPMTGALYAVGDKWKNTTCTCYCIGKQRGAYKCECKRQLAPIQFDPNICEPDNSTTCYSCPSAKTPLRGDPSCGRRKKCDKWPYTHVRKGREIPMTCTCYGPEGFTQCVWRKRHKRRASQVFLGEQTIQVTSATSFKHRDNTILSFEKHFSI